MSDTPNREQKKDALPPQEPAAPDAEEATAAPITDATDKSAMPITEATSKEKHPEAPGEPEAPKEKRKKEKKDNRRGWLWIPTILLLIIIIILILLLLRQCSTEPPILNPDYPPASDDPNGEAIPGDDDQSKLEHEEGGGAVSLQFRDQLIIDLSDKKAYLYFANPGRSTQDMMLQIVIQEQVIVQSGRLRPGYQVQKLDLLKDAEKMLVEGTYNGKFVVYYYDPVTNERAMVNTDAPVTITVKN